MPQEIVDKFQQYLDELSSAIVDTVRRAVPGLSPEEQQDVPVLQSQSFFAHCLFRTPQGYYLNTTSGISLYWSIDVELEDNDIKFGNLTYLGKDNNNWSEAAIAEMQAAVKEEYFYVTTDDTGELYVRLSGDAGFTLYSGGVYYNNKVHFHCDNPDSYYHATVTNGFGVRMGQCTYTIDAQGRCVTNLSYAQSHPSNSTNLLYAINAYPIVGNIKDTANINSFIGAQGATNNYSTTYTTPDNKTITVYYGDNYIITHVNDDEPVSYNDVKNALNIAVNKINDDNDTDMSVPNYPIPPDPDDDDIDEQDIGVGTNLGGLGGYWLLTKAQLADLHGALDTAPVGFDPLNSFISLMGLGVDASKVLDATQFQYVTPINIRMSDGTTWSTGVEAHIISSNEIVSAFNSDTFRIQRKFNNFLDYSPYATHELFIPMCGWVTLPDIAVDRDIYVTYIPDIESCKCRAVVSVVSNSAGDNDACVIAEKDGIMGSDIPFSNVGHSLFVGDAIINGANVAGEVITGAIGAGFTKTNAKGGTYRPYEGFTVGMGGTLPGAIGNAFISGNINRTHFMTGNSTKIGFSDGESIIVKSVYHLPDMPENYAHTVGLVCNKTGQLSEFSGFTVCDNPHITFSALEAEKEEIKRLLEEGVILPSGE